MRKDRNSTKQGPSLSTTQMMTYLRLKMKVFANIWALKHYRPQLYPKQFHLFLTKESFLHGNKLKWADFSEDSVEVHEILGTHRSITGDNMPIMEEEMQFLGKELRNCIDNAMIKEGLEDHK
jgi:hypothetical protein